MKEIVKYNIDSNQLEMCAESIIFKIEKTNWDIDELYFFYDVTLNLNKDELHEFVKNNSFETFKNISRLSYFKYFSEELSILELYWYDFDSLSTEERFEKSFNLFVENSYNLLK